MSVQKGNEKPTTALGENEQPAKQAAKGPKGKNKSTSKSTPEEKPWGFYELLQVGRDASPTEVKKAYRRLAIACHPDRYSSEPLRFALWREVRGASHRLLHI